jgi:hypothetical protein
MTDFQFYLAVLVLLGWGVGLGLGIAKVFETLSKISLQLEILPEISDRLKAVHEAIRSAQRNPNQR